VPECRERRQLAATQKFNLLRAFHVEPDEVMGYNNANDTSRHLADWLTV
jgi:hypothetical protein